jgi:methylaspartate ammonia-lyase
MNMKLEQQVCSVGLATRLHELEVRVPSLFFYEWTGATEVEMWVSGEPEYCLDNVNAYTVAELGDMLPKQFDYDVSQHGTRSVSLSSGKTIINDGWYVMYNDPHPANKVPVYSQHADTEADARAKMLIYLLENKLIAPI